MQIQDTLTTTIQSLSNFSTQTSTQNNINESFMSELNLALEGLSDILERYQDDVGVAETNTVAANVSAISTENKVASFISSSVAAPPVKQELNITPSWVNPSYYYDPANPRKPNMREVMEALSGQSVESMYEQPNDYWQPINNKANMLLYGVIGNRIDERAWQSIDGVSGQDFEKAVQRITGDMYQPKLSVVTATRFDGEPIQVLELTGNHNLRRPLTGSAESIREAMLDFGATKASVPTNIEELITSKIFDSRIVDMLKTFDVS